MNHTAQTNTALMQNLLNTQALEAASSPLKRNNLCCQLFLAGCLALTGAAVSAQTTGITVRASATLASNVGPQMQLRVNGAVVASTEVRAASYQNYSFPSVVVPAAAKVDVVFDNDAYENGGDRNLFVESITVNGGAIASTAAGVVFDRGPGAQAFDDFDVMPGRSALYWNGALRFKLAGATTPPPPPPPTTTTDTPPAGYSRCAAEWETCRFTGSANVVYGARSTWTAPRSFTGGTACTNSVFGDPLRGTFKACYLQRVDTPPPPPPPPQPTTLGLNLTLTGTGGVGFSDGSSCAASCAKTFNRGSTVTMVATPSVGFTFAGWGGACSGTGNCTLTMETARNVSATFSANPATLSVSISGSGSVNSTPSGINCGSSCSAAFTRGANVTLTATPATGFAFTGWSGACSGTAACSVTLSASANVNAAFAAAPPPPPPPVAGLSCPITNATVASAGGQQLVLNVSRNTGVAPLAVFFDASGTTATGTTRPFHDLEYRWSFGDTASGTWTYGAKAGTASRNEAMGPVAAHVFENAGTYPITVSAFNGTSTVSYNCNITVLPADVEFAGNKTVCVSGVGNFAGCPAGALHVTSANPTTAVANNIGTGNKRILFARGETFSVSASISINRPGPGLIGAFGSGAKPMLRASSSNALVTLSSAATPTGVSDWRFQDLAVNGNLLASAFVGSGSASQMLLNRVDISNVGFGVLLSGSTLAGLNTGVPFAHAMWDEFYMVDSTSYNLIPGQGPNAIFANSYRMVVMGSLVDNNLGGEHGIRMQLANRTIFSDNTIQGIAPGKVNLSIRGVEFSGSNSVAAGTYSEKVIISNNRLMGGNSGGIMGIGPQNGNFDERGRNMLVERNWFTGTSSTQDFITINQPDVTVRNNLVYSPSSTGGSFVTAKDEDPRQVNIPTRVNVYNNSMYHGSTGNYFALFFAAPNYSNQVGSTFEVRNNILYAPIATQAFISGKTSAANITATNNTVDPSVSPLFATNPPTTPVHFTPSVSSYANGAGIGVRVHSDFDGLTTQSTPHLGAKRPITGTPAPTPLSLNLSVSGTGGIGFSDGSSCTASCAKTFNRGSTVTLVAAPSAGFAFAGWGGACSGTGSCTVTMDAAKNVSATFSAVVITRTLNLTIAGTGGVGFSDSSSCASSCSKTFNNGSVVTLATAPSAGFTFAGWSGACSGSSSTCTVTMDAAKNVSATFSVSPAMLSVSVSGSGAVNSTPSGINCGSSCSAPFAVGSQVTLTATPGTGFTFTGWSGACTGTAACSVTLSASANINAAFAAVAPPPPPPLAGLSCPTTNATVTSAGGQQLALNVSRNTGVAPLAVFFDASDTTATGTTRPFHDLEYRWTFGDSGSGTWNYGAKAGTASRNEAMGPVAAHVFENAGTYPVTVSAFNGTNTVSYSCNITVTSADAEFANNKTVCVSATGDFAGCPAGAAQVTGANATSAISGNIGTGNKRILFRRGETFNVSSTISINQPGPGMIGAYGSGAKPVIASSIGSANSGMFGISTSATPTGVSDWRFQDLTVEGISGAIGIANASTAFYGDGSFSRVLLHRVDMRNVHYGVNLSEAVLSIYNRIVPYRHAIWDEFYVVDSSIFNLTPGSGPNSIFASATRAAVLGTSIDNNGGGEHGIRFQLLNRGVLSHNNVRNTAVGKTNMTIRGTNWAGNNVMPPGTYSEKNVVSSNKYVGGLGIGPQNDTSDERGRNMIVESNWWHLGATLNTASSINQPDVTIRNNFVYVPGNNGGAAFGAKPESVPQTNIPTRVNVYNNTVYHAGTAADYNFFIAGANNGHLMPNSTFDVRNNIMYAPNITNPVMASNDPYATSIITHGNNSTNPKTNPLLRAYPPLTTTDFTPASGSYANGGGTPVPVWSDFFGVPVTSTRDMGAAVH